MNEFFIKCVLENYDRQKLVPDEKVPSLQSMCVAAVERTGAEIESLQTLNVLPAGATYPCAAQRRIVSVNDDIFNPSSDKLTAYIIYKLEDRQISKFSMGYEHGRAEFRNTGAVSCFRFSASYVDYQDSYAKESVDLTVYSNNNSSDSDSDSD